MYIVVPMPVYPVNAANMITTLPAASPVEYYNTKEQLKERLRKGGAIRVFEATELNFALEVTLTPKAEIAMPR